MNTYFVDEAVLSETAEALIKEKYPGEPLEKHAALKTDLMKKIDHQISKAFIGSLTQEQGEELAEIMDKNPESEEALDDFFQRHNIDLQTVFTNVMIDLKNDFLKGDKNA